MRKFFKFTLMSLVLVMCASCLYACDDDDDDDNYPSNAIIIETVDQLYNAVNNQQDNQFWVLKSGIYTLDSTKSNIGFAFKDDTNVQSGWLLPLIKDNLTIVGDGDVEITYNFGANTGDGAEHRQNLVTIYGDNVTLRNLDLVCNGTNVNKSVCVFGKNLTMKNVEIETDSITGFAGSLYFCQNYKQFGYPNGTTNVGVDHHANESDIGTVRLENVDLNRGRITATGAGKGTFIFKNVDIEWEDVDSANAALYPVYALLNNGKTFAFQNIGELHVDISTMTMGSTEAVNTAKTYIPQGAFVEVEP